MVKIALDNQIFNFTQDNNTYEMPNDGENNNMIAMFQDVLQTDIAS